MKPATKAAVETAVKEHLRGPVARMIAAGVPPMEAIGIAMAIVNGTTQVVVAAFKTEIKARKKDAANG